MGKRKAELCPKKIAHQFKKRKVENANEIVKLLIQLEIGSNRQLLDCIAALTDIALQIIQDKNCVPSAHQKPDDLKDALDKFKDWIQDRLKDIIKKFISLLYHSKSVVAQKALSGLTSIIRQKARTNGVFPSVIYSKLLTALLSNKVNCHKLIQMLEEPLKTDDLSFYTLKILSRLLRNRGDNTSMVYKSNVVSLVLLLRVAPKKQPVPAPALWCSIRKGKAKKNKDKEPKTKIKILNRKSLQKKEREERVKNHRKSKYEEVLNQTLNKEGKEEEPEDEDDEGMEGHENEEEQEEQPLASADVDSDEEQRQADDQEFKAGQKVKAKRKRRDESSEAPEAEEDVPLDYDPDNANQEPVRKSILKPVSNKNRLLPPGVLGLKSLHELPQEEEEEECVEEKEVPQGPLFKYSYELACQYLSIIWERLMSFTLTEELYKRCLVFIPEHVMEFLRDPVSLTDFFMSSYNCGGGVSLLAMHGVFLLMTKHNLQYPQFYQKVHRLLEPSVFNARYKPRFFILLNVFLSSSHLPEYIAAAFAKSLSHLVLFAPANCTLLVIKVLSNLLNKFPSLKTLYDDETEKPMSRDPFAVAASDLMKGGGTESSLWEVATLNKSAPEQLYKATLFIRNAAPPDEVDISPHLETFYEELDPSVASYADNIKKAADNFLPVKKLLNNASSILNTWFVKEDS